MNLSLQTRHHRTKIELPFTSTANFTPTTSATAPTISAATTTAASAATFLVTQEERVGESDGEKVKRHGGSTETAEHGGERTGDGECRGKGKEVEGCQEPQEKI